jgi:hypothetical protein
MSPKGPRGRSKTARKCLGAKSRIEVATLAARVVLLFSPCCSIGRGARAPLEGPSSGWHVDRLVSLPSHDLFPYADSSHNVLP